MSRCPKCRAEIDSLKWNYTAQGDALFVRVGSRCYYDLEKARNKTSTTFSCPKCGKVVCKGDINARRILK